METGEIFTGQSAELGELATALAKAQGAMAAASKSAVNPHFKSRYADLASIWDACREALSANGLSVVQTPQATKEGVWVVTRLLHSSGQWISGSLFMPTQQATAQGVGSAITYARRYSLAAMVGVAPDDDDGHDAAQPQRPAPGPRSVPQSAPQQTKPFASDAEVQALWDRMDLAKTSSELKLAGTAANEANLAPKDRERLSLFYVERKKALSAQPAVAS